MRWNKTTEVGNQRPSCRQGKVMQSSIQGEYGIPGGCFVSTRYYKRRMAGRLISCLARPNACTCPQNMCVRTCSAVLHNVDRFSGIFPGLGLMLPVEYARASASASLTVFTMQSCRRAWTRICNPSTLNSTVLHHLSLSSHCNFPFGEIVWYPLSNLLFFPRSTDLFIP